MDCEDIAIVILIIIIIIFCFTSMSTYCYNSFNIKSKETFANVNQNKLQVDFPNNKSDFVKTTYIPVDATSNVSSLYSPFILRPHDIVSRKLTDKCSSNAYSARTSNYGSGDMGKVCCPENEARNYAMRPILTPDAYNSLIELIFKNIVDPVPTNIVSKNLVNENEFGNNDNFSEIMKFVMYKINQSKDTLSIFKQYAKNDTWGGEKFAFTNEKVFMFTESNPNVFSEQEQAIMARKKFNGFAKYILTFTLVNTLRSISTDVVTIIYSDKEIYYLSSINFATSGVTENERKGSDGPDGFSFEGFKGNGINLNSEKMPEGPVPPDWIYGNTIENETFTADGFHSPDPSKNILIPGGVPAEYEEVLKQCEQASLTFQRNPQSIEFPGGYQDRNADNGASVHDGKGNLWKVVV
jgi:hypothetical protein